MDNTSIKNNIRSIRKERKYTQEEVADMLGISLTAYRDLEKGSTSIVNGHIIKIADLFNISTEELVLGYQPQPEAGIIMEDVRHEYGNKIGNLEKRIQDLEKLVRSLEETVATKNEIITMLRKTLDEAK
jgi:transcriptional regulator with XRE-family HTH domain